MPYNPVTGDGMSGATTGAAGAPNPSGVGGWFNQLSPEVKAALIAGGFSMAGGIASGIGQQGMTEAQIAGNQSISRMNNATSLYNGDTDRLAAAGKMMGNGPLDFARQRAGMSLMGSMLGAGGMGSSQQVFAPPNIAPFQGKVGSGGIPGFQGSAAAKFFTPEAMAGAEAPYWQAVSALNPDINPNLAAAGYGDAAKQATGLIDTSRGANANRLDNTSQAVWGALGMGAPGSVAPRGADNQVLGNYNGGSAGNPMGTGVSDNLTNPHSTDTSTLQDGSMVSDATMHAYGAAPKGLHWTHNGSDSWKLSKDGSGFWHKFAKVAGIAGAGIATAMSGGAASPLLAAAIGAGSGAAAGWGSGGGTKGALLGAAMGGAGSAVGGHIPGLGVGGGGGGGAAATGIGGAVKQTLLNPQFDAKIASEVLPGRAGQVAGMASGFLPGNGGSGGGTVGDGANPSMNGSGKGAAAMDFVRKFLQQQNGGMAGFPGGGIGGGMRYPMDEKFPGQTPPYFPEPGSGQNQTLQQILPLLMQLMSRNQQPSFGRGY